MNKSRKLLIGTILSILVAVAIFGITWSGRDQLNKKNTNYSKISKNLRKSVELVKIGNDPSDSLKNSLEQYNKMVKGENFENQLETLNGEIKSFFNSLISQGKEVKVEKIGNLNKKIGTMASKLGIGLPIAYKYPSMLILCLSVSLAFIGNYLCRKFIDWKKLEEDKESLSNFRKKYRESKRKKGKKKRKLELQEEDYEDIQRNIWQVSIKQAIFYLPFFVIFLAWLGFVYGDWIVAFLPFNWLSSGLLRYIGVSFNYYGWFFLSFFGFAYFWREILVPE
ncbi:hypothetical protein AKJ51_04765 [candidate division MSBL1 archaeon SCGC-AAA382A20]|uniref:DUF106 domain-containing protein n=1 Tax=candidate division MSBL1 archaeon SCGC-AAA382A20 TaxID=1698280 RepID=A0A133VH88_9EURY|nr:hypothetical protein AKJ51_04765 [candidate division MSBL1 archaeon SCGC-AAA382A20]